MSRAEHPAYALIKQATGVVARISCARCPSVLDVPIRSGISHSAVVPAKARQAGWLFQLRHPSRCVCRDCYLGPRDPVPDIAEVIAAAEPTPTALSVALKQAAMNQPAKEALMNQPMTVNLPFSPADVKGPTPAQKLKIRAELDANYDEALKLYLDRQTDKSIADKLGVPWGWVRDLREVAYGPLEGDAELLDIRAEHEKLANQIAECGQRLRFLTECHERVAKRLQEWEGRR